MSRLNLGSTHALLLSRSRAIIHYFTAQGFTMAANLLFGLLCVRMLPASEYAKFAVLFGVQGTLVVLMDLNFTGTLIPLVGERVNDHKWIADHVASLRTLSHYIFGVMAIGTMISYPFLVKHRGWSLQTIILMIGILLVSTWFVRVVSAYGAVLILFRARPLWYRGQMVSAVGSLIGLFILAAFHHLNAFSAILLNVAGIIYTGIAYFWGARKLIQVHGESRPSIRLSIIRLALPNVPQSIFFALQGQVSLFLITFFGKTNSVASVGALARLAAIFIIFKQANSIFTEPYFAILPRPQLGSRYFGAIATATTIGLALLGFAWVFPSVLLKLLGRQYEGLDLEVLISVGSGAIGFLSNVLWTMNSARRFVYWWNVSFSILLTLVVQILFMVHADMSTIRGALYLSLGQNIASLFVNMLSGTYGFARGPRETATRAA